MFFFKGKFFGRRQKFDASVGQERNENFCLRFHSFLKALNVYEWKTRWRTKQKRCGAGHERLHRVIKKYQAFLMLDVSLSTNERTKNYDDAVLHRDALGGSALHQQFKLKKNKTKKSNGLFFYNILSNVRPHILMSYEISRARTIN